MPKLVVLSAGMTGRTHELKAEAPTTIGRVEDNQFQIAEASVSSHHCEISLRGSDVVIKDLGSTNGTFINGEKISEGVLKPGQTLRLGQVELKLETEGAPTDGSASAPAPSGATVNPVSPKRQIEQTMVMRGVSLNELEQGGRTTGFDTSKAFSKKRGKTNKWFWIGGIIVAIVITIIMIVAFSQINNNR